MMDLSLKGIGELFTSLREAVTGEKIKDPIEVMKLINSIETTVLQAQSSIITAEAKSEHWIVASWRPITMLVFVFIIFNNYVLVPYLTAFGATVVTLELTDNMWDLLKLGLGGYIVGRSIEKTAKNLNIKKVN